MPLWLIFVLAAVAVAIPVALRIRRGFAPYEEPDRELLNFDAITNTTRTTGRKSR
jgi:hypothetical protein